MEAPRPQTPVLKPAGKPSDAAEEMKAKVLAMLGKKAEPTVAAKPAPPAVESLKAPATKPVSSPTKAAKKPSAETVKSPKKAASSPKKTAPSTPLSPSQSQSTPKAVSPTKQAAPSPAASAKPTDTVVEVNSVVKKENGKAVYTVETLLRFRTMYTELPTETEDPEFKWPSMEIQIDTSTRPSRGGGGRGGAGWERGSEKPGLNRQASRGGSGGKDWARSQQPPREGGGRGGGRGRGGRGGRGQPEPLFDGPVKPLERTDNRWIPVKATSNLEAAKKKVNSIMNKMTREKFEKLAKQITEIDMESLEMLKAVITIIFDKALGEPHFCDMYADLCVHLEQNWKVWSFLKIVQNDDDGKFYWTTMDSSDSEVVGPFVDVEELLDSAASDEFEPVPAPEGMKLNEVRVRASKFIKIWTCGDENTNGGRKYYWSGQLLDDLDSDQVLNGPFDAHEHASRIAIKSCSFKRILLNSCQEEFEKDNIYDELDKKFKKDKEAGALAPQDVADYEEKRMITKARMLGNIRFIGELYRKGMLQERIMHECVMKLMGVRITTESTLEPVHPNDAPDEESIESLTKLLTTIGRDLDKKNSAAMNMYFAYLERKLVKDKRLSSRIVFMLRDTIELRENNWQPRRKELKSKSLDEIRKEAEREQRAPPASAPGNRPDSYRMDNRRSASSRDGGFNQRGDRAPMTSFQSQSMNSKSGGANKMQLPLRRGDDAKTGSGRPATFGGGAASRRGPPASAGPVLTKKPSGSSSRSDSGTPRGVKEPARPAPLSDDDKEKIGKTTKAFAEEYVSIKDLAEAERCYSDVVKEFQSHPDLPGVIATQILLASAEAKDAPRLAMYELLEKLSVEKGTLPFEGIRTGIQEMLTYGANNWCDVPKFHEHLANFIIRFARVSDKSGVTMDWLLGSSLQSLESEVYEELVQGDFLAALCGTVLKQWTEGSAEKAHAQLRSTMVTLLSVFPDYKQNVSDFSAWTEKYGFGEALGLQPAIDFANVWAESKDLSKTVEWYQSTIPENVKRDPVFAVLACAFVLDSVPKGEMPGDDAGMLLNGVCVSLESHTRLVATLFQTRGVDAENAADFKASLKHLVKQVHAIPGAAFAKWLELKNDSSVGRKRALQAFGDFVEELAKFK